jgi:hypothetical protein
LSNGKRKYDTSDETPIQESYIEKDEKEKNNNLKVQIFFAIE